MPQDHDALFRTTFSQPEHATALLRGILPAALARAVDWTTLARVPGSFVDEHLRQRHTDLLFTVQAAGQPVLLYLVLEHKSSGDRFTALQLLGYAARVLERHRQAHPTATVLPPVVPIVVHHGKLGWRAPRTVLELVDLDRFPPAVQQVLSPLQPSLHFLLDDLAMMPEARLRARPGTAQAALTLLALQFVRDAAEGDPVAFAERWLPLWRALWAQPGGRFGLLSLFSYLAAHLEAPEERFHVAVARIHEGNEDMGKTIAEQWLEQGMQKGLAKGKAEGKAEGRAEMLLRQIRARFGDAGADVERTVRAAGVDTLDRWAERILSAASLDELFA